MLDGKFSSIEMSAIQSLKMAKSVNRSANDEKIKLAETIVNITAELTIAKSRIEFYVSQLSSKERELKNMEDRISSADYRVEQADDRAKSIIKQYDIEELKCESLRKENINDKKLIGNMHAEVAKYQVSLARFEAMYEAEKRARIVAETALAQNKIEHEKQIEHERQLMSKPEEEVSINQAGWRLTPHRDTADNLLFMTVDPVQ